MQRHATMTLPHAPEDWPRSFCGCLDAGDIEGALALYDRDARFVTPAGEVLVGRDRIRNVIAGLVEMKTHLESRVVKVVAADDVAILYTDFHGTSSETPGATTTIHNKAIEVLRRSPDGTWRLVVGDPNGRMRHA